MKARVIKKFKVPDTGNAPNPIIILSHKLSILLEFTKYPLYPQDPFHSFILCRVIGHFSSVQFSHSVVSDTLLPHGHTMASLSITNS